MVKYPLNTTTAFFIKVENNVGTHQKKKQL